MTMKQTQGGSSWNDQIGGEIEKLSEENKKQGQRIRNLEAKTLQNVNLYFIFQAIVLATTTAATASCHEWWIPFTLSLFAAVTNLFSFCDAVSKVLKLRERLDQGVLDLALMKLYQMTKAQVDQALPGTPVNHQGGEVIRPKVGQVKRWKRRLLVYMSVGLFLGFTMVLMYGCYSMLCHPGHRKCVKLC